MITTHAQTRQVLMRSRSCEDSGTLELSGLTWPEVKYLEKRSNELALLRTRELGDTVEGVRITDCVRGLGGARESNHGDVWKALVSMG